MSQKTKKNISKIALGVLYQFISHLTFLKLYYHHDTGWVAHKTHVRCVMFGSANSFASTAAVARSI
jgi:hypothetical protein